MNKLLQNNIKVSTTVRSRIEATTTERHHHL